MQPEVIFDASQAGLSAALPQIFFLIVGVTCALFGILFYAKTEIFPPPANRAGKHSPFAILPMVGIATYWSMLIFNTYAEYRNLIVARENGKCSVTEGVVENFRIERPGRGGAQESFEVSGVKFSFSSGGMNPGFKWTVANGSPIKNGLHVRIYSYNKNIARLEVLAYPTSKDGH